MFRRLLVILAAAGASGLLAPVSTPATGVDRFPVTVAAANGKVKIPKRPVRIVSISPTATETLFAIGAGPQVVAVDDQSDYPLRAPRTKLSGFTPNVEAVAGYRPDLVIVSYDANGIVAGLRRLRIPVLLQTPARGLPDAYAQIRTLGVATGRAAAARGLATRMKSRIATLSKPARSRGRSVYHEISPDYYAASSKSFVGSVYGLFGVRNIADEADSSGSGYPKLSAEYILASNPDLIVLADTKCCGQTRAGIAARPGWNNLKAVRNGAIVVIDDSIASRWGPRIVNFARALQRAFATIPRS